MKWESIACEFLLQVGILDNEGAPVVATVRLVSDVGDFRVC